jgi:flagellar biosynthesis/type III secretory pathway chaperone
MTAKKPFIRSVSVDEPVWRQFEALCNSSGKSRATNLLIYLVTLGYIDIQEGGSRLQIPGIVDVFYNEAKQVVAEESTSGEFGETQSQRLLQLMEQNRDLCEELKEAQKRIEELNNLLFESDTNSSFQAETEPENVEPFKQTELLETPTERADIDPELGASGHAVIAQQARLIDGLKRVILAQQQQLAEARAHRVEVATNGHRHPETVDASTPSTPSTNEPETWEPAEGFSLPLQLEGERPVIPASEEFMIVQNLAQLLDQMPNGEAFESLIQQAFTEAVNEDPVTVSLNPPLAEVRELATPLTV